MDDTIEGLLEAWTGFIEEKYGVSVNKDDITDWDLSKAYPTLTNEQIYAPLLEEDMWDKVKPFPDAIEYLKRLKADGHDVIIVTASHYNSVGMKMEKVLGRYFPFIPYNDVIIASRKQMITGDVLIDDSPRNLIGGTYKGILYEAPHNRGFNAEKYKMKRAKSWSEVYSIISDMENKEFYGLIEGLPEGDTQ